MFHSKFALVTKMWSVAYKILHHFCFGGILAPVQILGEFCKTTNWLDWACYSVRAGGVLCRRGRAAASSVATRLATQLLAAVPRPNVLIRCQFNAARIKPRAAVENFFSLYTPTPTSSLRPSNSRSLLPFQATRARQQLRQELRHRLHPLAQALIPHKPQPSRSPSTPAEAPSQALHRGQLISGLLNRRSLPCRSRGEPLVPPRPFPRSLTALDDRGLAPRCFRPPELWPGSLGALRDHVEHARPLKGSRRTYWSDWLAPGKTHRRLGDRRSCGARRKTQLTGGARPSVAAWGRQRPRATRESSRAELGRDRAGRLRSTVLLSLLLFLSTNAWYLNLCRKLYFDPKIMEIFV